MLVRSRDAPNWHSPKRKAYKCEAELRELIAHSPSLLPGVDEQRPVALATELGVPAVGQADVVVVDADGEITVVECKLAKNAEIRRWVIGQAFSYAAGLWRLGYEELEQALTARGADLTSPFTDEPDWDEAVFRDAVAENLAKGAFRLVIAVDEITDELKRTVVYINRHTVPELRLLALELRYAVDEGVEILLPEVYGEESAGEDGPGRTKRRWDEDGVLAALREVQEPELAERLIRLYEWMRDAGARASWGSGGAASVTMWLGEPDIPVSVYFYAGSGAYPGGAGGISIDFSSLRGKRAPAEMKRLADLLRQVPGVAPYVEAAEEKQWAMHGGMDPARVLATEDALEAWKRALAEAATPVSNG